MVNRKIFLVTILCIAMSKVVSSQEVSEILLYESIPAVTFNKGKEIKTLDSVILAWPVISFRSGLVHKGSMKNLLGENPAEQQIAYFSPDEWVNGDTPTTFLVHAGDDASVSVSNSIRFYEALKKSNVPAELHIYEKGGHGFGIAPEVQDSWMGQLEIWLKNRGLISSQEVKQIL